MVICWTANDVHCLRCDSMIKYIWLEGKGRRSFDVFTDNQDNRFYSPHRCYQGYIETINMEDIVDTVDTKGRTWRDVSGVKARLEEILIEFEAGVTPLSKLLTVSRDGTKKLVVGIGHDIVFDDNLKLGDTITAEEMLLFFRKDVSAAMVGAAKVVDDYLAHPPEVQVVLAAMVFQMGQKGVAQFKRTLDAVNRQDYNTASVEMLNSTWAHQTPVRAESMATIMRKAVPIRD